MNAQDALLSARASAKNNEQLTSVIKAIKEAANRGEYQQHFIDLTEATKMALKNLGYHVTSHFCKNESTNTVGWYEVGINSND